LSTRKVGGVLVPTISQLVMLKAAGAFEASGMNISASQRNVRSRHTEYRIPYND